MNNCIEKMRECYKFDDDKTEILIGDMIRFQKNTSKKTQRKEVK